MRWPDDALALIDGAAAAARAGEPTVVSLEGEAGDGKSTLLRELVRRLGGFHVLRAAGEESTQDERLQLLREWDAVPEGAAVPQHTLQAARMLGDIVDRLQLTGPVALAVDDLQWIDPDSADALAALVQRAAGDRLLVATAYLPLGRRHAAWRRVIDTEGRVIRLGGLDSPLGAPHPVALAVTPLAAVVAGEPIGPAIARSRAARLAGPMPAAVQCGDMTDVAALAFAGTDAER
jgi:AAA ATPase domain